MTVWCTWLWLLQYEDVSFIRLRKADRCRLISCFHSYFQGFFQFWSMSGANASSGNAERNSPKQCGSTCCMVGLGRGLSRRSDLAGSLLSLFNAAPSGLRGDWENASLCLQIFTRVSVDFFTLVSAICLCFLRWFLSGFGLFFSTPTSKRNARLSVVVWHAAYIQEPDTDKKRGFKVILLQVNSGNHVCRCSSVVLSERSILTGDKELWSEEGLFLSHLERISLSVSIFLLLLPHSCFRH